MPKMSSKFNIFFSQKVFSLKFTSSIIPPVSKFLCDLITFKFEFILTNFFKKTFSKKEGLLVCIRYERNFQRMRLI